ncbi:MAG: BamA/TamA family outer membrane protein [candidate division Zixibacteria bacterium]|nr:BamA/TamA family outer membrane protein [candidate division Zixibacteria bacterium]MBU1470039.1 BamA/TamA family outer membrane protein [candidate division Zixibacteria bacterium]
MRLIRICLLLMFPLLLLGAEDRRVSEVRFSGDYRIREWILQNEIEMKQGVVFSLDQWNRDQKRLSSLSIFSDVTTDTSSSPQGVQVHYHLDEVWTLIPLLNVGGEIDNIDIEIGFKDKDFLGLFLEPGFIYSHFEDRDSYETWLNWPRAFGTKNAFGISFSKTRSHEPADLKNEEMRYDYDVKRTSLGLAVSKRITETFVAGVGATFRNERYRMEPFEVPPLTLPQVREQKRIQPSASVVIGRVYYDNYFFEGRDLSVRGDIIAFDLDDYRFKYWMLSLQGTNYYELSDRWNLCSRLVFGASKTGDVLPTYAISGFSNVRGAEDRTRRGSKIYYCNAELRFRAFELKWLHSQLAAFIDFGNAWDNNLSVADVISESYLTGGLGFRVALRHFHNAVGRADIAYNSNNGSYTFYVSAGQFF